ncbi:MAG: hypothetical protein DCC71_23610 [Proteobacteria bacterium]|nr:MAG: hypothetical protein DCC71_23610 [Pseudomonadota bacterium]
MPLAQRYFDQGLALAYGFNHDGAIDSFREAARLDPRCAMCWWGVAFASGPNINAPMGPASAEAAWNAVQEAQRLAPGATAAERDWIDAVAKRYAADFAGTAGAAGAPNRIALDRAFAEAMRALSAKYPNDADAAAIHAESLLDLSPWSYWNDDGSPREFTGEAAAAIERALALQPDHTGGLHYKIHFYERFEPEKAEAAADRLAVLAPDAGHLVHMPAHIYYRLGRYRDSSLVNQRAAAADVAYFAWCRSGAGYAVPYYAHNLHFLWASEMAQGRGDSALATARQLASIVRADQLEALPFLEDFAPVPVLTLVRFGRWDAALAEPAPPASMRFTTAMWRYARGFALARTGRADAAAAERDALAAIQADPAWANAYFDTSGGTAGQRLDIALHHLDGEIAAARGDVDGAVAHFERAVAVQDAMPYAEPPPFYFPVRQAQGAVLLAAGRAKQAEAVYREDLRRYPRNGWSLLGLSQSLAKQGRAADARYAQQGFRNAWSLAEVEIAGSRF